MRANLVLAVLLLVACGGGSETSDGGEANVDAAIDAGVSLCGEPQSITMLLEETRTVTDIAVRGTYLYWTSVSRTAPVRGTGTISRLDMSTGSITELASGEPSPDGLAAHGDALVWINYAEDMMMNGSVVTLSLLGGSPTPLATGEQPSGDLFVDGGFVYFVASGAIRRVPKSGGAVETVVVGDHLVMSPFVDGGTIYWLEKYEPDPAANRVMKRALPDGTPEAIVTNAQLTDGTSVVVKDGTVYWSTGRGRTEGGMVMAVPASGGTPAELVPDQPFGVDSIDGREVLVDETHVYVATDHDGHSDGDNLDRVLGVPRTGGAAETVAISTGEIRGLAMDDCNLYWIDNVWPTPRLMTVGK